MRFCKSLTRICTVAAYDNCQHIDVRGGAEILTAHTPDTHTDCNRGNSAAAKQNSKYRVRNRENVASYNYKEGTYITLNTFFSVYDTSEIFCMGNIPRFVCCIFCNCMICVSWLLIEWPQKESCLFSGLWLVSYSWDSGPGTKRGSVGGESWRAAVIPWGHNFPLLLLLLKSDTQCYIYISVCIHGRAAVNAPWSLQEFNVQVPRMHKDSTSNVPFGLPHMGIWIISPRLFHRDKVIWIAEGDKSVTECAWEDGRLHLCTE